MRVGEFKKIKSGLAGRTREVLAGEGDEGAGEAPIVTVIVGEEGGIENGADVLE